MANLPSLASCACLLVPLLGLGCSSKLGSVREALEQGDTAKVTALAASVPCPDASCLDALARLLGSKSGFDASHPDQAAAGAVAILLVRDHEGNVVPPGPDVWMLAMSTAAGAGADALRLAVARGMTDIAPRIGKHVDDESEAKGIVHDLAGVLPGSCETYVELATAPSVESMAPELRPDHAPCVQHDLERREGPGASYGYGVWRAAAAIGALWKDEVRALRAGLDKSSANARRILEADLGALDAASANMAFKAVPAAQSEAWTREMQLAHGMPASSASALPPVRPAPSH